ARTGDVRGVRVGVPRALVEQGVDPDVASATTAALDVLQARGAALVDVDLPHARYATPVYYLVSTAEASSNLARYDGVRYGFRASGADLRAMYGQTRGQGFGREVKRRIMLGTYVLSAGYYDAYYLRAQRVRTLIRRDFDEAFREVDVIATPVSPTVAFKLGEKVDDPLAMYLADISTLPVVPAGPAHSPGLAALFAASHSTCYCRYWHFEGDKNAWLERCALAPDENRTELDRALQTGSDEARGLVALVGSELVGWLK